MESGFSHGELALASAGIRARLQPCRYKLE
jgi:hypothetical protein